MADVPHPDASVPCPQPAAALPFVSATELPVAPPFVSATEPGLFLARFLSTLHDYWFLGYLTFILGFHDYF